MIKIEVIDGISANASAEVLAAVERGTIKGLNALALMAQAEAQRSILKGPKTGRIYKRGKTTHQASAPGEAPANDLGFLAGSLKVEVTAKFTVDLIAAAPYAVFLEYGTRKMAPRPFMRPAGDKAAAKGSETIGAYVRAETR